MLSFFVFQHLSQDLLCIFINHSHDVFFSNLVILRILGGRIVYHTQNDGVKKPKRVYPDLPNISWSELKRYEVCDGPELYTVIRSCYEFILDILLSRFQTKRLQI